MGFETHLFQDLQGRFPHVKDNCGAGFINVTINNGDVLDRQIGVLGPQESNNTLRIRSP